MIFIPQCFIEFPVTLNMHGRSVVCNSEKDLEVLADEPSYRLSKALAARGVLDYDDFRRYSGDFIPCFIGCEELSSLRNYEPPYYYKSGNSVLKVTSPYTLSDRMISAYKNGKSFEFLPEGRESVACENVKYPLKYQKFLMRHGIYDIDALLRYTRGIVPVMRGISEGTMRRVVSAIPGDVPYRKVFFPIEVTYGDEVRVYEDSLKYYELSDDLIFAYKSGLSIHIQRPRIF